MILTTIAVGIGYIILIVPGIILSIMFAQSYFILADNNDLSAIDCIKASCEMMKGNKMYFFILMLSFIGWFIIGEITCGIGLLWVMPYYNITIGNFYDELSIDSNLIISILRIINELNSNAIKYSNGTEIIINVTLKDNNVIIEFKDNGKGFDYYNTVYDKNKNSGFGLTMLKERVALLNGNIKYIYDNGSDFFIEIPVW